MLPQRKTGIFALALLIASGVLTEAKPASAQQSDDVVRFRIQAGGRDLYKVAIPLPIGEHGLAQIALDVCSNDLALAGYFKVVDPKAYLANLVAEQLTINPQDWRNIGAEGVIKGRATAYGNEVRYEFRLYEIAKGDQPVLQKEYRGPIAQARALVHAWATEVVRYYTAEESFFSSRIAFSSGSGSKRRDLLIMDWDGANVSRLTDHSQNLLPAWSPSGSDLAFTSFLAGKPDLYLISSLGGKPRSLSSRAGVNMGASYSPDGNKIAATLSFEGNSEIYLISPSGSMIKRLTNNAFIDSSPTWSPDGSRIAFVSNRFGNPQIWMMGADGSGQTKLTRRGTYNQEPCWCPRKDQPLIAFSARDEKYAYDIFTVNVETGEVVRVTEGHGSNLHPSWAPNGRAIVYESTRGGIWISTADGRTERQVYKGSAAGPAWGPLLPASAHSR